MNKLKRANFLLHEVTVVNFLLLFTLIRRYKYISLVTPLIVVVIALYYYHSQNIIYIQEARFTNIVNQNVKNSTTEVISLISGGEQMGLSSADIVGMTRDWNFHNKLATRLVNHKNFYKFNFNSLSAKSMKTVPILFETCHGELKCIIKRLRGILPQYCSIGEAQTTGRYILKVKSLDKFTTIALVENIAKTIEESSYNDNLSSLVKQMTSVEQLIKESTKKLEKVNSSSIINRNIKIENEIVDLKLSIKSLNTSLQQKELSLSSMKSQLGQINYAEIDQISPQEKQRYDRIINLKKLVRERESSLATLTERPASLQSDNDKQIIKQLKNRVVEDKAQLKKAGALTRSLSNYEAFLEKKDVSASYLKFDSLAIEKQISSLKRKVAKKQKKFSELIKRKTTIGLQIKKLEPDIEYIKLLESKLASWKLIKSTITSDLAFDKVNPEVSTYKMAPKGKIILFSTVISLFLMLIFLVIRYLFDDKIYCENDIKGFFENIEVIGKTPEFED